MKLTKLFSTKRRIAAVLISGGIVAASAGIAAAYFSATGSGSATATVRTPTPVILTGISLGTITPTKLYHVGFTADNTNSYTVRLGKVKITSVTVTSTHATCNSTAHPTWFTFGAPTTAYGTITPGKTLFLATTTKYTPTFKLLNKGPLVNQTVCETAHLTLHLDPGIGT